MRQSTLPTTATAGGHQGQLTLYDNLASGNGYKVRLLLAHLRQPFTRVELDLNRGDAQSPKYHRVNPAGQIPALQFGDGRVLTESNAILYYMAQGSPWWPDDPWAQAHSLRWLFFEQYSHEPYVAVARSWVRYGRVTSPEQKVELERKREKGRAALTVLDRHLAAGQAAGQAFLVAAAPSIADIALYAYTHVAPEGGIEVKPFPALMAWLDRMAALPGHVPITHDNETTRHFSDFFDERELA